MQRSRGGMVVAKIACLVSQTLLPRGDHLLSWQICSLPLLLLPLESGGQEKALYLKSTVVSASLLACPRGNSMGLALGKLSCLRLLPDPLGKPPRHRAQETAHQPCVLASRQTGACMPTGPLGCFILFCALKQGHASKKAFNGLVKRGEGGSK